MYERKPNIANSGQMFEEEVLGHCTVSWDGEYLPWKQALWQVRNGQPWDTHCPRILFMQKVLKGLNRELGSNAEFYTAVGSALDKYHGVDGYFYFEGIMVTIDASLRRKDSHRADILLVEEDSENPEVFAHKVAETFSAKRNQHQGVWNEVCH